jgi:hypothetical protein
MRRRVAEDESQLSLSTEIDEAGSPTPTADACSPFAAANAAAAGASKPPQSSVTSLEASSMHRLWKHECYNSALSMTEILHGFGASPLPAVGVGKSSQLAQQISKITLEQIWP